MPPDDDDLIDAAPCPKCKSPLAVVAADIGHLIECPTCGTQSRARRAEPPADAPRRRDWDGDRDDDRRPRDRDRDDRDDDRRPRERERDRDRDDRRSRYREDDYDRPAPRRPGQGAAIGAAVMNFVFAAIALIEGICIGIGGFGLLSEARRWGGGGGGGPFGGPENAGMVLVGFSVCNLIGVGLMIPSGVGLLTRRDYGRTLGFLSAGLGLIYAFSIIIGFFVIMSAERGGRVEPVVYVFVFLGVLLWLGYGITNLALLGKVRPESRSR